MKNQDKYNLIGSLLVLVISLIVYIYTLCPTIYWEDSTELSAAIGTLGLAHSPSFPIYILIGRLFSYMPIGNIAFRTNLFSAVLASVSLLLLYNLILVFLKKFKAEEEKLNLYDNLTALSATLILAFTSALWINAVRAEVYSLNCLMFIVLVLLLIEWSENGNEKLLFLFSFIYGLSFGNHSLLMFLCGPAFLYFVFANNDKISFHPKRIILYALFFILGMSAYLFLPLRSICNPLMDWGNPQTLGNFIEAFSRKTSVSYSKFTFSGIPYVFATLAYQFTPFVFWLGIVGLWIGFKKNTKFILFSLILLAANMLYVGLSGAYNIENYDGQGYLIISYIIYAVWIAIAFRWILELTMKLPKVFPYRIVPFAVMAAILFLPFFPIKSHFQECNKRGVDQAYRFGESLVSSMEDNSIVLVNNASPLYVLWYLKYIEGQGKNIKVIDRKTLKMKSYRLNLMYQYPEMDFPTTAINIPKLDKIAYLDSLKKATGWFVREIIAKNQDKFPIYWENGTDDSLAGGNLVPYGLLFKIKPGKAGNLSEEEKTAHYKFMREFKAQTRNNSAYTTDLKTREYYSITLCNIGNWFYNNNLIDDAIYHYLFCLDLEPSNFSALNNLAVSLARKGRLKDAAVIFERIIRLNPKSISAHDNLGLCFYKMGQPERARYYWEKALKIDNNDTIAIINLRKLGEFKDD